MRIRHVAHGSRCCCCSPCRFYDHLCRADATNWCWGEAKMLPLLMGPLLAPLSLLSYSSAVAPLLMSLLLPLHLRGCLHCYCSSITAFAAATAPASATSLPLFCFLCSSLWLCFAALLPLSLQLLYCLCCSFCCYCSCHKTATKAQQARHARRIRNMLSSKWSLS